VVETRILAAEQWRERMEQHLQRARRFTGPARERRDCGLPHPIADFLYEYYPFPFSTLEQWHPETGTTLQGDEGGWPTWFTPKRYASTSGAMRLDPARLGEKEIQRFHWIRGLLVATRDRPPNYGCHGLHEWAMVYRGRHVRHEKTLPLRLNQSEIDALVESRPICCSHYDAFRFFAAEARPLNRLQPALHARGELEQPACIHANMDLYKWAAKAMPWVGSDLLLDCFELAVELRDLDMRASPYDLSAWGREAVRIETDSGRREYEEEQRHLSARAKPCRERLIQQLTVLLANAEMQ